MKNTTKILLAFMLFPMVMACKKNAQDKEYKDASRVMLEGLFTENATTDSTQFTFANLPIATTETNLTLVARISGPIANVDRTYKVVVDPKGTTALPSEYQLPATFTIKAGKYVSNTPILIRKTPRMDNSNVTLVLRLESNENFQTSEKPSFKFVWTNDVTKPRTWDGTFVNYLGKYSKAKHRLVISSTEYKDLNKIEITTDFTIVGTILYIRDQSVLALNAYNLANPSAPLKNEENNNIAICRSCE